MVYNLGFCIVRVSGKRCKSIICHCCLYTTSFYLSQERQYRDLYKAASLCDPVDVDFSLDATPYKLGRNTWPSALISSTIALFYGITTITVLAVMFFIQRHING